MMLIYVYYIEFKKMQEIVILKEEIIAIVMT